MKILIIGWYGTETIGDRAILASLIMHFSQITQCEFSLASIYPFFSERTLKEDAEFISTISGLAKEKIKNMNIVDARNPSKLKQAIRTSDYVVMGGGPLDDMMALYMVEFSVLYAKKNHKTVILYGIGLNVLKNSKYKKAAKHIIESSDCTILRDKKSLMLCQQLGVKNIEKIKVSIDPAVFSAMQYKQKYPYEKSQFVAINLRKFPQIYAASEEITANEVDERAQRYARSLVDANDSVLLVPMSYFDPGIDDRIILCKFKESCANKEMQVINKPYNLQETFAAYRNARYCIGMRFHAVVFQTILNGDNYIFDYTDPKNGKIGAFIQQISGSKFYDKRMAQLQFTFKKDKIAKGCDSFTVDEELIAQYEKIYTDELGVELCTK